MTPFSVMETANQNLTVEEYFKNTDQFTFSRIPIYDNTKDNIVGYVLKDKILEEIINQNKNQHFVQFQENLLFSVLNQRSHIFLINYQRKRAYFVNN